MKIIGTQNQQNRDAWVEKILKKIPKGKKILDAGAGEQQYKKYCKHLNYTSQDFAEYAPEKCDQGLQMPTWDYGKLDIISDIGKIPVGNSTYDVILCTEVFEHIINPELALKEFKRILKNNGLLIITAPFASYTHFAPFHFATGFSKYYYEALLPKFGFKIQSIDSNGNYFQLSAQELLRLPSIIDKYISNKFIAFPLKLLSLGISLCQLCIISIAEHYSENSDEIAVFGFHVIAKKI